MTKKSKSPVKLTIQYLVLVALLFAILMVVKSFYLPKEMANLKLVKIMYPLIGGASLVLIGLTYYLFQVARGQMHIYYLSLTLLKLGAFMMILLSEENIAYNVRLAILIPIMLFLVVEKIYGYFLFQTLEEKKQE